MLAAARAVGLLTEARSVLARARCRLNAAPQEDAMAIRQDHTIQGSDAAAWDAIARGYDEVVTPSHMWLGHEGLQHAGLRAGMRFLDVAAGSGALSIPAARLGARVLAVDRSPAMLERLGARARAESVAVETHMMDGHALALPDESFDMAGSQFGVMLFPDMPRGLREMARVVKPGGRVLVLAYGDPARIEFLAFLVRALRSVRPGFALPDDPPPLPFQLRDPERLRRELAAAGASAVEVHTIVEPMRFESGRAMWRWLVSSNPIVESVLGGLELTEQERGVVQEALERLVRERAGGQVAAEITAPINIGVGIK
jgi:ubiquinone/menaquinone biosynthesis C-methylase UbiE